MEKNIFSGIIEVEKEIQRRLDVVKMKSQKWIEKVKTETEEEILKEEEKLKKTFNMAIIESKSDAERKADEIVKNATVKAERLKGLSDDDLLKILMRHIVKILPDEH